MDNKSSRYHRDHTVGLIRYDLQACLSLVCDPHERGYHLSREESVSNHNAQYSVNSLPRVQIHQFTRHLHVDLYDDQHEVLLLGFGDERSLIFISHSRTPKSGISIHFSAHS